MYRYISCESVSPFDLLPCYLHVFRELYSNAISGTLPDAIGLLTGLWSLCVAARPLLLPMRPLASPSGTLTLASA